MWQKSVRYLDYNASAGITPVVREKLSQILTTGGDGFANPSSRHRLGQRQSRILNDAADKVAASLGPGVESDQIIFTSSGTESNQTILRSFAAMNHGLILGAGEHSSSFEGLQAIKEAHPALWTSTLPLTRDGNYDLHALPSLAENAKAHGVTSIGLSLAWANGETGVVLDFEGVQKAMRESPLPVELHLDGAQAWGKLSIDLLRTPASSVSFSGHKIGAPAGTGLIWVRPGATFQPLLHGSQARGRRGGTENFLGILGMGFAAETLKPDSFEKCTKPLQSRLEAELKARIPGVVIFGESACRVANTVRFGISGFERYEHWVELLDLQGFAVSHGSACRAHIVEPSKVLLAMGVPVALALNSVRVSFGPETTENILQDFIETLSLIHHQKGRERR